MALEMTTRVKRVLPPEQQSKHRSLPAIFLHDSVMLVVRFGVDGWTIWLVVNRGRLRA